VTRYSGLRGKALLFLLFLWCLWFLNFSARTIFTPILPLLEDEFVVTHARASSIFVFQSVGYAVALLTVGFLSGRLGYKRSIFLSLSASAIILLLIPLTRQFYWLYLFSFALGFTTGLYIPSVIPLITENYPEKVWGRAISIHDTAASASTFAVPFLVLFILHFLPWRGLFYVMAVAFLAAAIAFLFVCEELKVELDRDSIASGILRNRTIWFMAVLWTFAAGANLGVYYIMPLYLTKELSLDIGHANTVFGFSRLGAIAMALSAGFMVDRFRLQRIMFAMLALTGILTIILPLVGIRHLAILLFLQASVAAGFFPVSLVAIPRLFPRELRGMATGIVITFGIVFGCGVIPYLLGVAGDLVSFKAGILTLGILTLLSSGLIPFFKKE
jgi:MFS family permease